MCAGATTIYTESVPGGTWSSSDPSSATIVGTSGFTTSISNGSTTIHYSVNNPWCSASSEKPIITWSSTVPLTGPAVVCPAATIVISDFVPGGTWAVTNSRASVGPTGVVTGIIPGTDTVIYTNVNMCGTASVTKTVTVNPAPDAGTIAGPDTLCAGAATILTESAPGGTWHSSMPSRASISATGTLTGISFGNVTISYFVAGASCTSKATKIINIISTSSAISGASLVCLGSAITLTDTVPGGTWSMSNAHASIAPSGVASAIASGLSLGADTVTYTNTNICGTYSTKKTITVQNIPSPGIISGLANICTSAATSFSETVSGGTWSVTNPHAVAFIGTITGVTPGLDTIVYTIHACATVVATYPVTINPSPNPGTIGGSSITCIGSSTALTDTVSGGIWSSSAPAYATINPTGVVTGVAIGNTNISYTVSNAWCTSQASKAMTVGTFAGNITGSSSVCQGATISLNDFTGSGLWSTTNANATVASSSPFSSTIMGMFPGIDTVEYSVTNICGTATTTKVITINAMPSPGSFSGPSIVCIGSTIELIPTIPGGNWTTSNPHATVGSATGIVTGITSGYDSIVYTITSAAALGSCKAKTSANITVGTGGPITTITGPSSICLGSSTVLADTTAGGEWSTTNLAVSISADGVVTGISPGMDTILYSVSNLCGTAFAMHPMVSLTLPDAGTISGTDSVIAGSSISLSNTVSGGIWSTSNTSISTATGAGTVLGLTPGTDSIIYTTENLCGSSRTYFPFTVLPSVLANMVNIENRNDNVIVVPNPSTGRFTVKIAYKTDESAKIIVSNMIGEKVAELSGTTNKQIDATLNLPSGHYILTASVVNWNLSKKIVIE